MGKKFLSNEKYYLLHIKPTKNTTRILLFAICDAIILKIHCLWTDPSHRSKLNVIITIIPRKTIRIPECEDWTIRSSEYYVQGCRISLGGASVASLELGNDVFSYFKRGYSTNLESDSTTFQAIYT